MNMSIRSMFSIFSLRRLMESARSNHYRPAGRGITESVFSAETSSLVVRLFYRIVALSITFCDVGYGHALLLLLFALAFHTRALSPESMNHHRSSPRLIILAACG